MNDKVAVFLYDYTGIMAQPWLEAGYTCYIIDGQHKEGVHEEPTDTKGTLYKVGHLFTTDINKELNFLKKTIVGKVEFVFGFPPCTDLAVSGAAHFAKKAQVNPEFQKEATLLAQIPMHYGELLSVPWGVENPVSVLSTLWRKPDFNFHPWEYGKYLPTDDVHPEYPEYIEPRDAYPKKTCIWCGGGFNTPGKKPVRCPEGYSKQHTKLGGKSLKTKNIRSATPRGFAKAVFKANGG